MDGTGNDSLLKTTKVTEWNFNYGGYITLAFGGFLLLGCVTAYVIAVARGNVDAFLPLISDAAGSPPQNGLFGTFICLGGMFGVAFMILRYMIVLEKNREKSSLVTAINKLSLFVGIASMLGITLVTGYPINFYRNREVWLMDVGLPHIIGGVMLFALGLVYIAFQCMLTLFLKTKNQMTLFVRILLLFICTLSFVYHMITVPDNFGGISHKYYMNSSENIDFNTSGLTPYPRTLGASLKLPIDTSGSYVASSITEWIFVIFFCCFFFTFFNEAQQYSLLIVIETHSTKEVEVIEDRKAEIRRLSLAIEKSSMVDTKPAPEVRKVLRRDSTSQTMTDGVGGVAQKENDATNGLKKNDSKPVKKISTKSTKTDVANGTKKVLTDSEIDEKLNRLLNGKKEDKNDIPQTKSCETSTSCDDLGNETGENKKPDEIDLDKEAERIAIEKIDVVVKDAEELVEDIIRKTQEETIKANQEGNGTLRKSDSDDALPSTCPLSIQ